MREVLIKAIPFDDLKITELEGVQQVNEHGELVFSGLMRGEKESVYLLGVKEESSGFSQCLQR